MNLKLGSSGLDVTELQQKLLAAGFNPGHIDGDFGPGTEAALLGFQRSEGLVIDGVVGPTTAIRLGLAAQPQVPSAVPGFTVGAVSQMFPQTPIGNIKLNLPVVLAALVADQLSDKSMVLMGLATIRAETESFLPISEGQSRFNTSPNGKPFDLYDFRRDLGNNGVGEGAKFRGRGFVQLTGRNNYSIHGNAIGLGDSLLTNPDLANDPQIAAKLLSSFLKSKEVQIKHALLENDLKLARRLVNGGSNGLDRFSEAYLIGDRIIPGTDSGAKPATA
jgi:putative chitinase